MLAADFDSKFLDDVRTTIKGKINDLIMETAFSL